MADYDPEHAFLLPNQEDAANNYNDAPMEEDDEDDEEESDYDPSSLSMAWQENQATSDSLPQEVAEEKSQSDASEVIRVASPTGSDVLSISNTGSQIPSRTPSANPAPIVSLPVKSPPTSVTKPRTIAGFAADDSEDEDSAPAYQAQSARANGQSALDGSVQTQAIASPLRSDTQTPNMTINNTSSSQSVSIKDSAAVDASAVEETNAVAEQTSLLSAASGANLSVTPQPQTQTSSLPAPPTTTASTDLSSSVVNTAGASSSVLPRQRLPTDVIGILEDRIAEDSRGDVDSWLSLISEYRKRNRFDEARSAWERFLTVFPTAVSIPQSYI
jgi:cleavage stimulation factor subunit 3